MGIEEEGEVKERKGKDGRGEKNNRRQIEEDWEGREEEEIDWEGREERREERIGIGEGKKEGRREDENRRREEGRNGKEDRWNRKKEEYSIRYNNI